MPYFAQLNDDDIAIAIIESAAKPATAAIEIDHLDTDVLGSLWNGSAWVALPDNRPELVVGAIACDDPDALISPGDITCTVGSTVTATATLTAGDGSIIPLNAMFRMPLKARDGRERVLLVKLVNGVANLLAPLRESGVWVIDERNINEGLPAAQHMHIKTQMIFVTES